MSLLREGRPATILVQATRDEIYIEHADNCRGSIDIESAINIADSLKTVGQLEPVLCRFSLPEDGTTKPYVMVAGYTRYHANFIINGAKTIEAVVREMTPLEAIVANWEENMKRKSLNIVQEAMPIRKLLRLGLSQKEIAQTLGKSHGWLTPRILVLRLEKSLQDMAAAGILTEDHIRVLANTRDEDERFAIARDIREQYEQGRIKIIPHRPLTDDERFAKAMKPRIRGKEDMQILMKHLFDSGFDTCLATRTLAWAMGTISDIDLMHTIAKECPEDYAINEIGFTA